MALRNTLIVAGFAGFRVSGLHRLARAATRRTRRHPGLSSRPAVARGHATATRLTASWRSRRNSSIQRSASSCGRASSSCRSTRRAGASPIESAPFAALTFDDGYRDTAWTPRCRCWSATARHSPSFARSASSRATPDCGGSSSKRRFAGSRRVEVGPRCVCRTRRPREDEGVRTGLLALARLEAGGGASRGHRRLGAPRRASTAMRFPMGSSWTGASSRALSRHPLATIGAHGLTHRRLAHWPAAEARAEMARLEGGAGGAARDRGPPFRLSGRRRDQCGPARIRPRARLGFATAVTTRPACCSPEHADRLAALPRVSVNGRWQSAEALEVLLSGAPFWLWNCGRRISA